MSQRKRFGLSDNKFIASVDEQLDRAANVKKLEIQTIPVSSISFQPGNPRKLAITPEDIRENLVALKLPPAAFEESADKDWLEDYEVAITTVFGTGQKKDDFKSIAIFAASMKSADRMLHPIVVWHDEGRFFKITGERRYMAHVLLGEDNIRASVWNDKPSEFELSQIQWDENNQREDFVLHESLGALEHLVNGWKSQTGQDSISLAQFQNLAGLGRTNAFRYLKILSNGTDSLRKAIVERRIDALTKAYEFAAQEPSRADARLAQHLKGTPVSTEEVRRERAKQGKRTRKKRTATRTLNFVNPRFVRNMRADDIEVGQTMVKVFRASFHDPKLEDELERLSLDKAKDVGVAFQKIFESVKARAEASKKKD